MIILLSESKISQEIRSLAEGCSLKNYIKMKYIYFNYFLQQWMNHIDFLQNSTIFIIIDKMQLASFRQKASIILEYRLYLVI